MKKMGKVFPVVLVLLLSAGSAVGQQIERFWTYGYDDKMDYACSIERMTDNNGEDQGYIIAGRSEDKYATVIMVNPRGVQEWEWQLIPISPDMITPYGEAMSVILADDGVIVAGWVTTSDNEDIFLARLSVDGDLDWLNIFGCVGFQEGTDVCTYTSSGSSELTGYAVSAFNEDTDNVLLITYDLQGNIEEVFPFQKTFGGYCYKPSCVIQTSDGGFAMGGMAGISHWYPDLGYGFVLKTSNGGQEEWCHMNTDMDHGAYGQCLVQRPNGNYYLLGMMGDGPGDYYPDVTVTELDRAGNQVGSPTQFTEIATVMGGIQSFGFSLESFWNPEPHYGICGEGSGYDEEFDLFFMAVDDDLEITYLDVHGLQDEDEGTIKSSHRPWQGAVACKVFNNQYFLTASTTYMEIHPNRDIYLCKFFMNDVEDTNESLNGTETTDPISISLRNNPCSGIATVRITASSSGNINLAVYDIQGRLVRTLADRYMSEGTQLISWNLTDESGKTVSPGVYFMKLQAGEHFETARLVLTH